MTSHPHQPSSDDVDPDTESSPAGIAGDLERKAEELGAAVGAPDDAASDPDSPGATIDDPEPAEPNEPG